MDSQLISALGDELFSALTEHYVVEPLTTRHPTITIADAYAIQQVLTARRLAAGERIIGKKIGVTSHAVMSMLGVDQPDFGMLTNTMQYIDGGSIGISGLLQPKAETEIAFKLKHDLKGPGVTPADVLGATESVTVCFEVVDSRIRDWKIRIQDTVADNASCGAFVLGTSKVDPRDIDLLDCAMVMEKNGVSVSTGKGSATMGSPLNAVAWLANALGELGTSLHAGEVILSGALGPMVPVVAGDHLVAQVAGIGECSVRFV